MTSFADNLKVTWESDDDPANPKNCKLDLENKVHTEIS